MRNPIACVSCRNAKQKCIHSGTPPCDRCKSTGRTNNCSFPPPGTSALHRVAKRQHDDSTSPSAELDLRKQFPGEANGRAKRARPVSLALADPFDLLTDQVKASYLRCSYKWCFHHTPTFLARVHEKSLEPWVTWSILGLAVRFSKDAPLGFATCTEASVAFASQARQRLHHELEEPSVCRIQALLMLTGHDWGAGNGRRAWMHLGTAIRMVQVLNLCEELPASANRIPSEDEFIAAEERRRTAWTCFLMDSLLSGGKGRKRSLMLEDMHIQLPCQKDKYVFGEAVRCERLDRTLAPGFSVVPIDTIGIIGHSLRAADIWGEVARWACSGTANKFYPWDPNSRFQQLAASLEAWCSYLPKRLRYSLHTLRAHNALDEGQAFCYMHCIYFMSLMFLHRAYLPVLGPGSEHQGDHLRPQWHDSPEMKRWRDGSRAQLVAVASTVCQMVDEMRMFGTGFACGLVPWIGFTVYTAVGVVLYRYNFHPEEGDSGSVRKSRAQVIRGCTFLRDMKQQWPMAQEWFETIKRMQACYLKVRSEGGNSIPAAEERTIRSAMVDYGALQPSPVQPAD
ncbi:hypothetical protein K490DRAFT_21066, partial [Saccharata proteae CBS 121410]